MATVLTTQVLVDTNRRALVKFVGYGGTDANTSLLDVSTLRYSLNANNQILGAGTDRKRTYNNTIRRIYGQGQMTNSTNVTLKWKSDTNNAIVTFGTGYFDYNFDPQGLSAAIPLAGANATGDIIFSSTAGTNDSWTLFVEIHKDGSTYDQGQRSDPDAFNWYTYEGQLKP